MIVLLALMVQPNPWLEIPFLKDTLHFTVSGLLGAAARPHPREKTGRRPRPTFRTSDGRINVCQFAVARK
ncbi:hypothetical protein SGLAM104S_08208 [Streptomyces glaucescens]